jgi:hypothetical protein
MAQIYLHSVQCDFAPTQVLPEPTYLGRRLQQGSLTCLDCGCGCRKWIRVPRLFWMRVVPFFRLYRCLHCGLRVFRPRVQQRGLYATVYMPSRPAPPRVVSRTARVNRRCG